MFRILAIFCCLLLLSSSAYAQTSLVSFGSSWRYLDNGSNQGTNWRSVSFKDTKWKVGNGKFGYGISDATTTISFGSNANKKYITTYFRKTISVVDPAAYTSLTFNVKRDDGAVIYVNGKEVYRNNMPTGSVSFSTLAKESADHGAIPQSFTVATTAFSKGVNVIAVEIHQSQANTPDMAFDLELIGVEKALPKDQTPPTVVSINRQAPTSESTSASSLTFRVTFSEKVTDVDVTDFSATISGTATGSVSSVTPVGTTGSIYDLTLSSVSGEGSIRLDLKDSGTGIVDAAGNGISGGYTSGQTYTLFLPDQAPPTVVSISRRSPTTESTDATSVIFSAVFSEAVTGVDASDFTATTLSGSASGTVSYIAAVGTAKTTFDITVNTITGEGTIRLDLKDSGTGITDGVGNAIASGYSSGEVYVIVPVTDEASPTVVSINRQDPDSEITSASSVTYRVNFSEQVKGVDASDFAAITVSGTASGTLEANAVISASATGVTYDVIVSSISGSGILRLDLKNDGADITDVAGNAISGGYTFGQTYKIEQAPSLDQPKVLYYEGFESGKGFTGMNLQTGTVYGFNVVGSPTYNEMKVGRWELRAGDPLVSNGTRAEVLFSEELALQETWHSFVGYFPSADNLIDTDDEAFNQWHQGSSFGRPMLTFRTENGRFEVLRRSPDGTKTNYYLMGSIIYDQWVHFVIHVKQHLTDGIMQVWINGELKMDYRGPTMFNGPIGRWKMGIYKSSWNNGAKTNSIKRVWYVDEVKVGNAASTFDSMKPVSGNNIKPPSIQSTSTQSLQADIPPLAEEQVENFKVSPTLAKRGTPVTITISDAATCEIRVSDVIGRTLYTTKFTNSTAVETMNLPNGLYFINLQGTKQSRKQKFIITD